MGISVPSTQFCYEPKTVLKNNSILKSGKEGAYKGHPLLQIVNFLCSFHP